MDELTADVIAFLSEGTRTGKLGYTASDGRPLVAPVWFVVDDGELAFNTGTWPTRWVSPAPGLEPSGVPSEISPVAGAMVYTMN